MVLLWGWTLFIRMQGSSGFQWRSVETPPSGKLSAKCLSFRGLRSHAPYAERIVARKSACEQVESLIRVAPCTVPRAIAAIPISRPKQSGQPAPT